MKWKNKTNSLINLISKFSDKIRQGGVEVSLGHRHAACDGVAHVCVWEVGKSEIANFIQLKHF